MAYTTVHYPALPWAWGDTVHVADGSYSVVDCNEPAIVLDDNDNLILTGMLESQHTIWSEEATNEVDTKPWTGRQVFADNNVTLEPAAYGLTASFRQAGWILHGATTQVVHKRGPLGDAWPTDTSVVAWAGAVENGTEDINSMTMAAQEGDVFVVYTDYRLGGPDHDQPYVGVAFARNKSEGQPGQWDGQTYIDRVEDDAEFNYPSMAVFHDANAPWVIHVCWVSAYGYLMYSRSINEGHSWSLPVSLAGQVHAGSAPSIQTAAAADGTQDGHSVFITWLSDSADSYMVRCSFDQGVDWTGPAPVSLYSYSDPHSDEVAWSYSPRMFAVRRAPNKYLLTFTYMICSSPDVSYGKGVQTIAVLPDGMASVYQALDWPDGPELSAFSCTGDSGLPPYYQPRLRTIEDGEDGDEALIYQGAECHINLTPVITGPASSVTGGGIARYGGSAGSHDCGVSSEDPCGDTIVCFRARMDDTMSGWEPVAVGHSPSVATDVNGRAWIVYARHESLLAMVPRSSDSDWAYQTIYAGSPSQVIGPPSLAVFRGSNGRLGNVTFPAYSANHSQILYVQFDSLGNDIVLDTVDDFTGSCGDSFPTVACGVTDSIWVTYGHSDTAMYRSLVYSPTSQTRPGPWSSACPVNPVNTAGYNPSIEEYKGRGYVAYLERPLVNGAPSTTSAVRSCSRDVTT
jgi:hypothetical protein